VLCDARQCRHTSDQNATIWRRVLLNRSTADGPEL